MNTYSVSLVFDRKTEKEIIRYSNTFNFKHSENNYSLDEKSKPHCTLVKWEAEKITKVQLEKINKLLKPLTVTFSGITILPSRHSEEKGGFWLEISILKSRKIEKLVADIIKIVGKENVRNEIGDLLRPHLTLNRVYEKSISVDNINPDLLRMTVTATPKLGYAEKVFRFYEE